MSARFPLFRPFHPKLDDDCVVVQLREEKVTVDARQLKGAECRGRFIKFLPMGAGDFEIEAESVVSSAAAVFAINAITSKLCADESSDDSSDDSEIEYISERKRKR